MTLIPQLDEDEQQDVPLYCQQDEAPYQFFTEVQHFLDICFPDQYNGHAGPITLPPRSPT